MHEKQREDNRGATPAVNTPQFSWVLSRLPHKPQPVPPIYQPRSRPLCLTWRTTPAASSTGPAARRPLPVCANRVAAPALLDRYLGHTGFDSQQTDEPVDPHRPANLWEPVDSRKHGDFGVYGDFDRRSHGRSWELGGARSTGAPSIDDGLGGAGRHRARRAPPTVTTNAPQVLRQYAVIADGYRGGLKASGDIAWLCFPTWESPTIFDTLLGGTATYDVHPVEPFVWGGYYEDGALIPRDRWVTSSGAVVECREALAFPAERGNAVVLRTLRMVRGLGPDPGLPPPPGRLRRGSLSFVAVPRRRRLDGAERRSSPALVGRAGGGPLGKPGRLVTEFDLAEGEQRHLVLELNDGVPDGAVPDLGHLLRGTQSEWHKSAPSCELTAAARNLRLAHAVLRGLTTPGGGTVAAVTTSLPERAAQGRTTTIATLGSETSAL